jgi:hypothetical protein
MLEAEQTKNSFARARKLSIEGAAIAGCVGHLRITGQVVTYGQVAAPGYPPMAEQWRGPIRLRMEEIKFSGMESGP